MNGFNAGFGFRGGNGLVPNAVLCNPMIQRSKRLSKELAIEKAENEQDSPLLVLPPTPLVVNSRFS